MQAATRTKTWLGNICLPKRFFRCKHSPYEGGFVPAHLKAAYQGSCVWVSASYQVQQNLMDVTRHWNVQSTVDHHTTSISTFS